MLEPHDPRLFLESLRPPEGFTLSAAIGTTYSLDLLSLLLAPIGFSLFDLDEEGGRPAASAPVLLEALRRYAEKIVVFCQAGQARTSAAGHPLLAFLEGCVVEVDPGTGGVFHPKVWLLRFESDEGAVRYRTLVGSRNLTFDRSWDTLVGLEGPLVDRQRAFARNHPLGDFVAALPGMATRRPVAPRVVKMARRMAEEVRLVDFEIPAPFTELGFWAGGIGAGAPWPFHGRRDRTLVISPFLSRSALEMLAGDAGNVVVSTDRALRGIEPGALRAFGKARVLSDAADPEAQDEESAGEELSGLHAKVYVLEQGWDASLWTGSANATEAAFSRNVELLVNLRGKKSACGVDAIVGTRGGGASFGDLLVPFHPPESWEEPAEDPAEALLEAARRQVALAGLRAEATPLDESGCLRLVLTLAREAALPAGVTVRCRPISASTAFERPLPAPGERLEFGPFGIDGLTSFFAFEATVDGGGPSCRFVVNVPLVGAPDDRLQRIVRHILRDAEAVIRFILLILPPDEEPPGDAVVVGEGGTRWGRMAAAGDTIGLFERIVKALHRTPERFDSLVAIIDDLRSSPDGARCLPEGFAELWDAAVAAREEMRR